MRQLYKIRIKNKNLISIATHLWRQRKKIKKAILFLNTMQEVHRLFDEISEFRLLDLINFFKIFILCKINIVFDYILNYKVEIFNTLTLLLLYFVISFFI